MYSNEEIIHKLSWKIFRLLKQRRTNDDLNDILNITVSELLVELEKNSSLKDCFTWNDLFQIFNRPNTITTMNELATIKTKNDLKTYVQKYILNNPEKFNFYFKFGYKRDFRSGYRLGTGVMLSLEKFPKKSKEFIKTHIPYERSRKSFLDKKAWTRSCKRDMYMHIVVKSIGPDKAQQKAINQLRRNYNILNFFIGNHIHEHDKTKTNFWCYRESTTLHTGVLSDEHVPEYHIVKPKFLDKEIKKINYMFNKKSATDLEQRILNAIDVYGLIEPDTPLHVRFLLCVIGLEGLLLGKDDRDYLGMRIAEKVSYLLADIKWWHKEIYQIPMHRYDTITETFIENHLYDARIKMNKKIKQFYSKRSSFAHSGIVSDKITESDFHWSKNFLHWSIERLIPMTKKYTHVTKKKENDKKYLDRYFETLRFS